MSSFAPVKGLEQLTEKINEPYAKWLFLFALTTCSLVAGIAALNAWVDPLHLIHHGRVYVTDRDYQRYINAGMIRTEPAFEAVFVGSSYLANFDADLAERLFGQTTKVIPVYGANFKETIPTLEYALKKQQIKTAFFDVSAYGWCEYSDHPVWEFPKGLYEDNPFSTLAYLVRGPTLRLSINALAFDFHLKKGLPVSHRWQDVARFYEEMMFRFDPKLLIPQIQHDLNLTRPPIVQSEAEIERLASDYVACFNKRVRPIIESNPTTQFFLLNPPILQQLLRHRTLLGQIQVMTRAQEIVAAELEQLGNVRYFDFYAAGEIENDCRRFMDTAHFDQESSDLLLRWMKDGRFERSSKTNAEISADVAKVASAQIECLPNSD